MQPRSPAAPDGSRLLGCAPHECGRVLATGLVQIAPRAGQSIGHRRPYGMAKRGEAR